MKNHLLAMRYARALSLGIEDVAQLDQSVEALDTVAEIYQEHVDFRNVLSNPSVDKQSRLKVLDEVLRAEDIAGPVRRLLEVLLERGRIALVVEVADAFGEAVDERLQRAHARVKTATALSPEEKDRLSKALSAYTSYDVRVKTKVDPKILGGVVVRIGSTVLDGSVRTRLNRLRETLLTEEGRVG